MKKMKKIFLIFIAILLVIPSGFSIFTVNPVTAASKQVDLVDSNASNNTKKLFAYLQDISGKQILFGQQHATDEGLTLKGTGSRVGSDESEVYNAVGDYPAVFGWDTNSLDGREKPGVAGDLKQSRENLAESMKIAHGLGGITTLSMHPDNFVTGGAYNDTTGNVVENILPGGSKNDEFNLWLDNIAALAHDLKDENGEAIPVIFRPFHEQTGNWFWWGSHTTTSDQYKAIFRYTVEYLRDTKNVHNFLYGFSPGAGPGGDKERYLETYPGDDYVDIFGIDKYDDKQNAGSDGFLKDMIADLRMMVELAEEKGKIAAFTEYGYSPEGMNKSGNNLEWYTKVLEAIKNDPVAKKIAYMQTWANFGWPNNMFVPYKDINGDLGGDHELLPNFKEFHEDEYTAFRDDIKGFYNQYGNIETVTKDPFMHVVSPVNGITITEDTTKVRVKVLNDKPSKVVYVEAGSDIEHELTLDDDGYYSADWSPAAAANGSSTELTIKVTKSDGTEFEQETVKVFVKVPEMALKKFTFDEDIDGIKTNGAYPDEISVDLAHVILDGNGMLQINAAGLEESQTWQELKLELTDVSDFNLAAVNNVKFEALVPVSAGTDNASLLGVVQLPPDWDNKFGEMTTGKQFSELERVTIDGVEYAKYPVSIDIDNEETSQAATSLAISLVGKELNLDGAVYIDNIELNKTFTEAPSDPYLVDDFESYLGDDALLKNKYISQGDGVKVSLNSEFKHEGNYGLQYDYTLGSNGYAGTTKSLGGVDWSEANQLQFWIKPDGKGQRLNIQLMIDGNGFEAYRYYESTDPVLETIDFTEFVPAAWANQNLKITKENLKSISNFSIYVDADDSSHGGGTLYFDDIKVVHDSNTSEVPDNGEIEEPTHGPVLFDFENGVDGWHIGYDENDTTEPKTVEENAINGSSLTTTFLLNSGKFSLQTTKINNLSGEEYLSAKVKLSDGTADAKMYIQTGQDWQWVDSGVVEVDDNVHVVTLSLTDVPDLDHVQAIGLEVIPTSGEGTASVYIDDVSLFDLKEETVDPEKPENPDLEKPGEEEEGAKVPGDTEKEREDPKDKVDPKPGHTNGNNDTDNLENDPTVTPEISDTDKELLDKNKDGETLPKTATNVYNWLVLGIIILLAGFAALIICRKKTVI